jgi:sec-independent protein translocase protein TatB
MFDIAFSEIVIIAVVALIVIGPERLPKTAKTLGLLFGRLQRYVSDVKADINRELQLEELRKLQSDVQSAAKDIESTVANAAHELESGSRKLESELNAVPETPPLPPPADVPAPTATADEAMPPGAAADAPIAPKTDGAPPAQGSLPGFERG